MKFYLKRIIALLLVASIATTQFATVQATNEKQETKKSADEQVVQYKDAQLKAGNGYNTNLLINPSGSTMVGWNTTNVTLRDANDYIHFTSTKKNGSYSFSQSVKLSENDQIRANKGELEAFVQLTTYAGWWSWGTTEQRYFINCIYYDKNNSVIDSDSGEYAGKAGISKYRTYDLEWNIVPKNTVYISYTITGTEKKLNFACHRNFILKIRDEVKPIKEFDLLNTESGKYPSGTKISYKIKVSEPVNVVSGGYLLMEDGTKAPFVELIDGDMLMYEYVIPSTGNLVNDKAIVADKIMDMIVKDDAGNEISITNDNFSNNPGILMDNKPPTIKDVESDGVSTNQFYAPGEKISFIAEFDEIIQVPDNSVPKINLNNGGIAYYVQETQTYTNSAKFVYTVGSNDTSDSLQVASIDFRGIIDGVNQHASECPKYDIKKYNSLLADANISIDSTPPIIDVKPKGTQGKWVGNDFDVTANVVDLGSGVGNVYSAWIENVNDSPNFGSNPNVGANGEIFMPSTSGTYYLAVKAYDNVKNATTYVEPSRFLIDLTEPKLTLTPSFFTKKRIDYIIGINVIASDVHSKLAEITYKWLNSESVNVASGKLSLYKPVIVFPQENGVYSLEVNAVDKAGLSTIETLVDLNVDATAPTITLKPDGTEGHVTNVTVNADLKDELTDVDTIKYLWTKNSEKQPESLIGWTSMENGDKLSTNDFESGNWYLQVIAKDSANNKLHYVSNPYQIDRQAPVIKLTPNGNDGNVGRESYLVAVSATDNVTPSFKISFNYAITETADVPSTMEPLDNENFYLTINPVDNDLYLHVESIDDLGNKSVETAIFVADTTAPTGTIELTTSSITNNKTIGLELSAKDDHSNDLQQRFIVDDVVFEWDVFNKTKNITLTDSTQGDHHIGVQYRDEIGNISEVYSLKIVYDTVLPKLTIDYDIKEITNKNVKATISATDNITSSDNLVFNRNSHVFSQNGTMNFTVMDEAGNLVQATAKVDWIDITKPVIEISSDDLDGKPHQKVSATIITTDENTIDSTSYYWSQNEKLNPSADWIDCSSNKKVNLENVDGLWYLHVKSTDKIGNENSYSTASFILDNTAPVGSISYVPNSRTAQDVASTITFNEENVSVTAPSTSTRYLFTDNGSTTFEFVDEAGNSSSITAKVDWIDRTVPASRISLKKVNGEILTLDQWINEDIVVSIVPPAQSVVEYIKFNGVAIEDSSEVSIINDETMSGISSYQISRHGDLTFTTRDTETNIKGDGELEILVDKNAPKISLNDVSFSTTDWTNKPVVATLNATDNLSDINYVNSASQTFNENGVYTYIVSDQAGNETQFTVEVTWIDLDAPIATPVYTLKNGSTYDPSRQWSNQDVSVNLTFPDEPNGTTVKPLDGESALEHVFIENGTNEFRFIDEAGNTGSFVAKVDKIDRVAPQGYVTYSENQWTNKDIVATLKANDDNNEVVSVDNFKHTFVNSGEYDFVISDLAGNKTTIIAATDRIDKSKPELSYTLSNDTNTKFDVYAFLESNEPIKILNNGGQNSYKFANNGAFTFKVKDRAGNVESIKVEVTNISKEVTPAVIVYSTTDPTSKTVEATLTSANSNEKIYPLNNYGNTTYRFNENGEFDFEYINDAGVVGVITASVSNIDKSDPVITTSYSTKKATNKPVEITFKSNKDVIYSSSVVDNVMTVTENGKWLITATDAIDNVAIAVVAVDWIDTIAPTIEIENESESIKINDNFLPLQGVLVSDDHQLAGSVVVDGKVDTTTLGDYTITYVATDHVGNVTKVEKYVTVYDPEAFNVILDGKISGGKGIVLVDNELDISVINGNGDLSLWYMNGKSDIGEFKLGKTKLDIENPVLPSVGFYTIMVMDQERQTSLINVFVQQEVEK